MQQRDILLEQIEQVGKALGRVISLVLTLDSSANIIDEVKNINIQLMSDLDVDAVKMLDMTDEEVRTYFNGKNFVPSHFEMFSNYFMNTGKLLLKADTASALKYFKKALLFLNMSDELSQTLNFEKQKMKVDIESFITKIQ